MCDPNIPTKSERTRYKTAIVWLRRNLRVRDNPALEAAVNAADNVIPLYPVSAWEREHGWTSSVRQEFLLGCLREMDATLRSHGGRIIFRTGCADSVI
jgi:deoxyribodipyrimidine photo-lyase